MHLLCRADAGPSIGAGHALRALAFAQAAQERDWKVTLAGDLTMPFVHQQVRQLGVVTVVGFVDATGLRSAATDLGVDAVLVDSYQLPATLYEAARQTGMVLASVEDDSFGRRPATVVIDYQPGSERAARPEDGSALVLRGLRYAPVRREVVAAREYRLGSAPADGPPRVLVVMGGTDPTATTPLVLDVLERTNCPLEVSVASGASALPALMSESDFVVTAAGLSAVEACCIGVPTAVIAVVPNQAPGYRGLLAERMVLGLGTPRRLHDEPDRVAAELGAWLDDVPAGREMAVRAAGLIDGRGCERVLDALMAAADMAG